jgi:hypothetical protein
MEDKISTEWDDPEYTKGFNSGHLIAKYEPQIAQPLAATLQEDDTKELTPYLEGLTEGIIDHERHKIMERNRHYDVPNRGKTHDKDKGRTKE